MDKRFFEEAKTVKKTHLISTLPAVPVLILFLTLLTVPAGAVDRGAKKIAVGQSVTRGPHSPKF